MEEKEVEIVETLENENQENTSKKNRKKKFLSIFINVILISSIVLLLARISMLIFFTNIYVTGPSMYPTLTQKDSGYTRKIISHKSIDRFDIIVIDASRFASTDSHWVKRVIALPGETISYELDEINKKGILKINGKIIEEKFIKGYGEYSKNNITYATGEIPERTLGKDEYFVMGDNRGHSTDSRSSLVGHIKEKEIFGVGIIITGRCGSIENNTCTNIKHTGIKIVGW